MEPNEPGLWTIRLDVMDLVGRQSTSEIQIQVNNIAPSASLMINGLNAMGITHYEFTEGEDMMLDSSLTSDTNFDNLTLSHSWIIDGEEISNTSVLNMSELEPGTYSIELIVTDNDGLTDSITISIEIKENIVEENGSTLNLATIGLFLVLICASILYVRKSVSGKNTEKVMPKWSTSKSNRHSNGEQSSTEDAELWQDSSVIDEGDD